MRHEVSHGVGLKVLRIVLVLALAFLTTVVVRAALTGPRTATSLPVLGQVADFALTEQNGRTVSAATLAGHVWVADFIFTRCSSTCPRMTARMAQLAAELVDRPEVRFVSFTVDPAHDSPEVLTRYAEGYRADSERWLFLTGSKEAIYRLTRESFRLGVEEVAVPGPGRPADRPGDPSHGVEDPFIHSTRFVLVDRQGRIRGYYDGAEEARIIKLRRDVETLLREGPPA
jgi:protein SCO1/2